MAEIGRWNGHFFEVSPDVIRGFTGLQIKGSSETEDKTKDKQKYVTRKNSKPAEVSITVNLNRMVNVDVRSETMSFVEEALSGATDYFYVGSKKLVNCKLMLTDVQVKEINIISGDQWLKADVQLTMKQADKYESLKDGSSEKQKKKSRKKGRKAPPEGKAPPHFADHTELTKLNSWKTQQQQDAQNDISRITGAAKAQTLKKQAQKKAGVQGRASIVRYNERM